MSDQMFKSLGVANNLSLRGQPFLVDNRINPVFVNHSENEALRSEIVSIRGEIEALKKQVHVLENKPVSVAVTPKPVGKPVVKSETPALPTEY